MSSVYATEPATSGRVIFETTHGPLDIHLWCRECPLTTKMFLQLCVDGFYDNMLFHRIVPGLLVQTGALRQGQQEGVTNSGQGEITMVAYRSSIKADQALERRKYEVNTRIRFNHRGQVAMALEVSSNDEDMEQLQLQFFVTTDEAPYLDGKHVIFGTCSTGPTIFNAIRIGGTEVDESSFQPVDMEHAPRIISTKIVENNVHESIAPRNEVPWRTVKKIEKKKKKRAGKFDVNVLSFGDDMAEDLVKEPAKKLTKTRDGSIEKDPVSRNVLTQEQIDDDTQSDQLNDNCNNLDENQQEEFFSHAASPENIDTASFRVKASYPSVLELPNRQDIGGGDVQLDDWKPPKSSTRTSSLIEERRSKYCKGRKSKQEREEDTLARLRNFKGKIGHNAEKHSSNGAAEVDNSLAARMARRAAAEQSKKDKDDNPGEFYYGQILDSDNEDEKDNKWLQTKFICRRHIDHTAGDGRDIFEYQVIDEKGSRDHRETNNKQYQKHGSKKKHRKHYK